MQQMLLGHRSVENDWISKISSQVSENSDQISEFTIMDKAPRDANLIRQQSLAATSLLADAAKQHEAVAERKERKKKKSKVPVIPNQEASGLMLLGDLASRPSIGSAIGFFNSRDSALRPPPPPSRSDVFPHEPLRVVKLPREEPPSDPSAHVHSPELNPSQPQLEPPSGLGTVDAPQQEIAPAVDLERPATDLDRPDTVGDKLDLSPSRGSSLSSSAIDFNSPDSRNVSNSSRRHRASGSTAGQPVKPNKAERNGLSRSKYKTWTEQQRRQKDPPAGETALYRFRLDETPKQNTRTPQPQGPRAPRTLQPHISGSPMSPATYNMHPSEAFYPPPPPSPYGPPSQPLQYPVPHHNYPQYGPYPQEYGQDYMSTFHHRNSYPPPTNPSWTHSSQSPRMSVHPHQARNDMQMSMPMPPQAQAQAPPPAYPQQFNGPPLAPAPPQMNPTDRFPMGLGPAQLPPAFAQQRNKQEGTGSRKRSASDNSRVFKPYNPSGR